MILDLQTQMDQFATYPKGAPPIMTVPSTRFCFDDRKPVPLSRDRPDYDKVRGLLERCRDFLRTNLQYDRPSKFRAPISLLLPRLLGPRAAARKVEERELENMSSFGKADEWPFPPGQRTAT